VVYLTFSELLFAVLLGDFHLEYVVLTDEGCHLRQARSTGAPNTNQKHVASELTDHTYNAGYCRENTKILHSFSILARSYSDKLHPGSVSLSKKYI